MTFSQLRVTQLALIVSALLVIMPFSARANELSRAFQLEELFEIMAEEGRRSALLYDATPLQGRALAQFANDVDRIYAPTVMHREFLAQLEAELESQPELRADALEFAGSELGKRVLRLEVSARSALLDDAIDETARLALEEARTADASMPEALRLALVRDRIDSNDLIDLNVSLGLNTSFAYYRGMLDEDAVEGLSADDLLQLVWAQQDDIRSEIENWIEAYFLMAYGPLSENELRAYVDYTRSPLAVGFNQAMFRAFDTVFSDISRNLGQALGRRLRFEEL